MADIRERGICSGCGEAMAVRNGVVMAHQTRELIRPRPSWLPTCQGSRQPPKVLIEEDGCQYMQKDHSPSGSHRCWVPIKWLDETSGLLVCGNHLEATRQAKKPKVWR